MSRNFAKRDRCNPTVASWFAGIDERDLGLSVLVLGELRKGIEMARRRDPAKAQSLQFWFFGIAFDFRGRILPVDAEVADEWGRMSALRTVSRIDTLMAATAKVHELVFVTRNASHVVNLGIDMVNPFDP